MKQPRRRCCVYVATRPIWENRPCNNSGVCTTLDGRPICWHHAGPKARERYIKAKEQQP